ncbi:MAG: methyltransferase domain-containing protein [Acidobacteria bacterium]|jgi:ubiquinone/menaquinone biosynthesis C-methylase UbiE|nr:methyltransferase domain-containing protein [Acidobacteriota bacterium]
MLKLFRGAKESPNQTAVSMVGARPGDSVLFCGADRPDIAGEVGAITGLNGQTTVTDRKDDAATRVAAAAATAGALVDFEDALLTRLPFDDGQWDAAVLVGGLSALGELADATLAEAVRVIRPGGRLILFDPVEQVGLFGRRRSVAPPVPEESVRHRLGTVGLRGARLLAHADGVRYFEAVKPR